VSPISPRGLGGGLANDLGPVLERFDERRHRLRAERNEFLNDLVLARRLLMSEQRQPAQQLDEPVGALAGPELG